MTMPISLRLKESQPELIAKPKNFPSTLRKKEIPIKEEQRFPTSEEDEQEEERARAQLTSRLFESILGAPGDIASFVTGLAGKEQKFLPTSQKLREFSEKATLGYTKPKTEFEESIGEVVSDVGSMAIPGTGHYNLARTIGIPVVANLIKEGIKYSGKDEKDQAYGKIGTMIALDLATRNKGGIKKYITSIFNKAEESIPKGISLNASKLENSLVNLENELSKGGKRPTSVKALEKISEIKNEIKNGKIDAKRLAAYRPSINEAIDELGGFQLEIPKKLKPKAIHNLNQVKNEVIKTLNEYGEKFNPEFLKYNTSANEGFAALQKSNLIGNFIRDKLPFVPQSKALETIFSYAPAAGLTGIALKSGPGAAFGATAALGGYQAIKVLHRIMNSPTLRKYYLNTLKEASVTNAPATVRNLKSLDNLLLKEES